LQLYFSPRTRKLGLKGTVIIFNIVLFVSATASLTSLITLLNRKRKRAIDAPALLRSTPKGSLGNDAKFEKQGMMLEKTTLWLSRKRMVIGFVSLGTLILWLSWLLRIDLKKDISKSLLRFQLFLQTQKK